MGDLTIHSMRVFGELEYLTIGHGSIMSGYSNYDRRGVTPQP